MQKFRNILSLSPNNCGPLRDTKISNFFHTVFHDASLKVNSNPEINNGKCEIAGIGVKKGVKMALSGMECIKLRDDVIKILGIYFSYN